MRFSSPTPVGPNWIRCANGSPTPQRKWSAWELRLPLLREVGLTDDLPEIVNPKTIPCLGRENFGHARGGQPPDGMGGISRVLRRASDHSILVDSVGMRRIATEPFEKLQARARRGVERQVARAGLVEADDLPGIIDRQRLRVKRSRAGSCPIFSSSSSVPRRRQARKSLPRFSPGC